MPYIPDRGDIIWLDLNPQAGKEHSKRRPVLVLSKKIYNEKVGLCVVCPITSQKKDYPFEVAIAAEKIKGVVLSDQVKSLDWIVRNAKFIDKANNKILLEIKKKLSLLIF